jgi:probable selenium-dependent hydroxylase accessory protein YqeC
MSMTSKPRPEGHTAHITHLASYLGIRAGDCVSIMGAGGKSTLMNRLADELIVLGRTAVLTSTTNYHRPKNLQPDQLLLTRDIPDWPEHLRSLARRWNRLLVLHHDLGPDMVKGVDVAAVRKIHASIPDAVVLVKTDGARKRWFKAPNQSEPVIPPWSQLCLTVVNLHILGQPLTEELVHRPERVAALTGLRLGDAVTPQAVGTVLTHPQTYAAKIPAAARRVVYISHVQSAADLAQAEAIAAHLERTAVDLVVAGDTPRGRFYAIPARPPAAPL